MTASSDRLVRENSKPTNVGKVSTLAAELADVLRRHLSGDQKAMADLVRSATPWLFYICRGYRLSTHTAEDVVQNTLLALTQHAQSIRDPNCVLSWLSVVAHREAIRAIEMERRIEPVGDMAALDSAVECDDPERIMEANLSRSAIRRNLTKLPRRKRDLLRLAFLADVRDYASIAKTLDMPIGSIGPTRQRGLKNMRDLLTAERYVPENY